MVDTWWIAAFLPSVDTDETSIKVNKYLTIPLVS